MGHTGGRVSPVWPLRIAVIVVLVIYAFLFWQQKQMLLAGASDFSGFYAAGAILDSGQGARVYDYDTQRKAQAQFIEKVSFRKGPLLFTHSPFELLVFAPLALLSYDHAVILWYALNVFALLAVPFLLRKHVALVQNEMVYALLAPAFFLPALLAITQGQDSIFLLILFSLVFVNLADGREVRSGCILALATFKPQLVLPLLLVMAVTRMWKAVLAFVGTCVALTGISIVLVGWRTTLHFPHSLMQFDRLPLDISGAYPDRMPNLRGLIYVLLGSHASLHTSQVIAAALSVLAILLLVLFCSRKRKLSDLDLSLVIAVSLPVSYYVHDSDLSLLVLPFFIVADYVSNRQLTKLRFTIVVGVIALFISPYFGMSVVTISLALLLFVTALFLESFRNDMRASATAASLPKN